jgi:uncharacterized membrane protein
VKARSMPQWLVIVTATAAVGSGIVGGVFFAFSTFVMKALDRLDARASIRAMQAINDAAPNAWFMSVLFGTAFVSLAVGVGAISGSRQLGTTYQLIGCVAFLIAVMITIAYHVPRNDALARFDPATIAPHRWTAYSAGWTAWNHARAGAAILAAAMFTAALRTG